MGVWALFAQFLADAVRPTTCSSRKVGLHLCISFRRFGSLPVASNLHRVALTSAMEQEETLVSSTLQNFSERLNELESKMKPVVNALEEVRTGAEVDEIPPLLRARVDATLAYAINAMFCLYLRTQGHDPTSHPVQEEIGRVRAAYMRIHAIENGKHPKPRRRLLASLHDAELELSKFLTEGERLIHRGVNGIAK